MKDNNTEITLTTLSDKNQVVAFDFNDDDDMDIDIRSSVDSNYMLLSNHTFDDVSKKKILSTSGSNAESIDGIENNIPIDDHVQKFIPRAVYDYATIFQQTLESSYKNRFNQDIAAVHGSSDPPPGFGFLHPRFRYLQQKRPIPLEPLPVWRGYNGNVYFSPIQVQQLEGDRPTSHTKSLKSASTRSILSEKKTQPEHSNSILPPYKNKKSTKHKNNNNTTARINTDQKAEVKIFTNGKIKTSNKHFKTHILDTYIDEEDNNHEPTKMWQTSFTSSHNRIRRILKRSQHASEDLPQKQLLKDPISYHPQVLPNIRPVSKSKYVHKGLAYKESQRLPGISNDNNFNDYTLHQAYSRHGINATRVKQNHQQLPSIIMAANATNDHQSQLQTSFDLREIRKRIVKGSTVACRTPTQSAVWTSSQGDNRSTISSDTFLPVQTLNLSNHVSLAFVSPTHQQKHKITHTIPSLPEYFQISSTKNNINIPS